MKQLEFRKMLSQLQRESKGIILIEEVPRILSISAAKAKRLLSRWQKQGWVARLKRGIYMPLPLEAISGDRWAADPWVIASTLFSPCYIGGWSACEHWGLTEQIFRDVVVLTARSLRSKKSEVLGVPFQLKTISAKKIYGTTTEWRAQTKVLVSDPSRTLIDLLDDPLLGGGFRQVLDNFTAYMNSPSKDMGKCIAYISRFGNRALYKRLGYLCAELFPDERETITACQKQISRGYSKLDASGPPMGALIRRWALKINQRIKS